MIDKRAFHPKGGWCVIRRILTTGARPRAVVDFEFGSRNSEVPLEELRDALDGKPLASPEPHPAPASNKHSLKPTWLEARKDILSLRLGQVTESLARRITVETGDMEAAFDKAAASAAGRKPSFLIVEGPWGTGKSHALALYQAIARERDLATGMVVLDGTAVTLGRPHELLKAIVHEISFPRDSTLNSFSERLADLVRNHRIEILSINGVRVLAKALEQIPANLANDQEAWELIENYLSGEISASACAQALRQFHDQPLKLFPLITRYRSERPERCVQLLGEWAQTCRIMPAHGLAILFDEVDVEIDLGGVSLAEREQRTAFLEELSKLGTQEVPLCILFALAPGTSTDLFEAPTEYLQRSLNGSAQIIKVPALKPAAMMHVAEKVVDLYDTAFPECSPASKVEWRPFAEQTLREMHRSEHGIIPRLFIRTFLEFLDVNTLNGRA